MAAFDVQHAAHQTATRRICLQGGSQALAQALLRGLGKYGGHLMLRTPVCKVHTHPGRPSEACSVELADGHRVHVSEAVVSNASVWDTVALLDVNQTDVLDEFEEYGDALEMNDSMLHLHLGFDRREGALCRICTAGAGFVLSIDIACSTVPPAL